MARSTQQISRIQILRYGILAGSLLLAGVMLVGPLWVEPIHSSGVPYHQLNNPDYAEYANEYISERVPQSALAVFVLCMALWLTNLIPLASTGLLAVALLPLLGIVAPKQAFAYFGNSAVFFILSVFLLAAAMIRTGLSKRLTLLLLQRFDRRPGLLVAGVTCSAAFMALWIPAHAVAAMMFPIILEIAESLGLEKSRSGYAKSLFFGLAWGAMIGGCGTFLGGARTPLAVELLSDTYRSPAGEAIYAVSFPAWMLMSMPLVIVLTAIAVLILLHFVPSEMTDITPATRMLNRRVAELGPLTARERRLAILGILTIVCWIGLGTRIDIAVIAILSAVALSALRIVGWRETQQYMNWGVVVMYGGAVALGAALKETHALLWLVQVAVPSSDLHPMWLLIIMAGLSVVLSSAISNAAAVAVLLPVGFALCEVSQPAVHPWAMTYAVTLSSGIAFVLPISSPPLAICHASGYYGLREVPKFGVPLTVLALAIVICLMMFYWPLVGVPITLP
ncbi:MAG: SLC13 family permease [Phycisphaerae bacterium]